MGNYKLKIKPSALKELEKIPRNDSKKIINKIKSLAHNPHPVGSEKLSGSEKYRIRQGNYRIIYSIENNALIVFVIKIAHRKDVYK
ncbi:MAG: type II toxin-antitoxin system RelE/ParE family toxin [Nitrospinae bacterium]|nr:type II toxin-antitoxin system RelE/ParE family toxin [Nitrospinota bacterium]